MRLDVSQQMRMDQRMVLAPRMIQSMEILQLPLLALQERIEQEMLANPVLEMEEPENNGGLDEIGEAAPAAPELDDREKTLEIKEDKNKQDDFERLANMGDDFDDYMDRSVHSRPKPMGEDRDRKLEAMQNTAAPAQSLNEYLHDQWGLIECEPLLHRAGEVIIDHIEETGYLDTPLESLKEHVRMPISDAQMEAALMLVQQLEPAGVGARDLRECLLLQLHNSDVDRSFEIELVRDHLKDIEMNRFPALAKKTGRSVSEIQDAIKNLSRLNPRPGLQVGRHDAAYVMPDIIVEYDENADQYVARLSEGSTPHLRISTMYTDMMREGKLTTEAKNFLQNNVRSARWLIESIQQRKMTLLRVVHHVIKSQREFLEHGSLYLKPLPMVDVASELGIHVGTVSRAVSGKYMQTPLGIYPLRYFFSGGTETAQGESVSWDAVRVKLQEIIDKEDKAKPYNDDELVEELAKQGITLARRTVAKYRDLMNVPPARRRKQYS